MGSIPTAKKKNQLMTRTNNNAAESTKARPLEFVFTRFSKKICTLIFFAMQDLLNSVREQEIDHRNVKDLDHLEVLK